jgi:hypothetical protein
MSAQGETYIVGQGGGVAAGNAVSFSFAGLPHRAVWPRQVALTLAGLILVAGVWFSVRTGAPGSPAADRGDLEARRDRLFAELVTLERQRTAQTSTARPSEGDRRRELMAELESVYAALDR